MTSEFTSPQADKEGTSLVFPLLAIPDDATLQNVVKLVSGMGASIVALGMAKPGTTAKEIMSIADNMMGRTSTTFSGDPAGIGMPVASAIAAAASADPEIVQDAERAGLNQIIGEVAAMYDCVGHKGPLAMVELPEASGTVLTGGFFDTISSLFSSDSTKKEQLSDRADRGTDHLSDKRDRVSGKISELEAEIAQLKVQIASTTDVKQKKKLEKKLEKLEKKLQRKESKLDRVTDKLQQWTDVADALNDSDDSTNQNGGGSVDPLPIEDDDRRRGGERNLLSNKGDEIFAAARKLESVGVPTRLANILAGYLIPNGVSDCVSYVTKLASSMDLSVNEAAKFAVYVASGMDAPEALNVIRGGDQPTTDIDDYLDEARAKNDAYRAAIQQQMTRLRGINQAAAAATRMYTRSEWADAILSSSDEVADMLQQVAPDATSTQSFIQSLGTLMSLAGTTTPIGQKVDAAIRAGVAGGVIQPSLGYALTGDPQMLPLLVVATNGSSSAAVGDKESNVGLELPPSTATNPVIEAFEHLL
jgi:TolA-binding protein